MKTTVRVFWLAVACLLAAGATFGATPVGGAISSDTTWTAGESPYLVQSTVTVSGTDGPDGVTTLTIEPGVEVRFQGSYSLQIGGTSVSAPGALVADGDAAGGPATIVLTSDQGVPAPGNWGGVQLRQGATAATVLRNVLVEYGGGGFSAGVLVDVAPSVSIALDDVTIRDHAYYGLSVNRGQFVLTDSTIEANQNHDVYLANQASVGTVSGCPSLESVFYAGTSPAVTWTGNTFNQWGVRTSRIDPEDTGAFVSGNTFNGPGPAVLEVLTGTVASDASWSTAAGVLETQGTLTVQGTDGPDAVTTLTLEPGVVIRFGAADSLDVGGTFTGAPGALIADGDAVGGPATIVLTSAQASPAPGDWSGVRLRQGATATTVLRNVLVEYGGGAFNAGVYLDVAPSVSIALDDVTIRDSAYYGLSVNRGQFVLTDSTIEANQNHDVYLANQASVGTVSGCPSLESVFYAGTSPAVTWTGNTFNQWGVRTSRIDPEDTGAFVSGNTFNAPGPAVLEVLTGTVASDASWSTAAGTFETLGSLTVQGTDGMDGVTTLTLEPGVVIRFGAADSLDVGGPSTGVPGALIADGDAAGGPATIVFTSAQPVPAPGNWNGVRLRQGATAATVLRNVFVEYGGAAFGAGVYLDVAPSVSITLDDVTIRESAYYGLSVNRGQFVLTDSRIEANQNQDVYLANQPSVGTVSGCPSLESVYYAGTSPSVAWSGNTFNQWGVRTSRIAPEDTGAFVSGNTFNAPGPAVVEVLTGTVASDASWSNAAGTFETLGSLTVQGTDGLDGVTTLTLEPGVVIRLGSADYLDVGGSSIGVPGALIADGDAAGGPATIVLTSAQATPAPGDWSGVRLRQGATAATLLRNVLVEYGGTAFGAGVALDVAPSVSITLNDVTIRDSAYYGLSVNRGQFVLTDSTIEANQDHDLYLANQASVGTVSGCPSLESVFYAGTSPSVTWTGNTFNAWGALTSRAAIADLGSLTRDNTFNPVPGAVLQVVGGSVDDDATWGSGPGPLVLESSSVVIAGTDGPDSRSTLTLEPGTTLRFPANGRLDVGSPSGDAGGLVADGRLAGGQVDAVTFNSALAAPAADSWSGIRVRPGGRAELHEARIQNVGTALWVEGVLAAAEAVGVNRADVGLLLDGATVEQTLMLLDLRNTPVGLRADGTDAVVRNSNLVGSTFAVDNLTPTTHCVDAALNWWGAPDGPSGAAPPVGCETDAPTGAGSPVSAGVTFDSPLTIPPDDGDPIPCNDGDGVADPCTGGNTVDCDDNCCLVANASQSDEDGDGTGDACDVNPVLRVSNDPADGADFSVIQEAVDATFQSGSRIDVLSGLGPYPESVRLDRQQVYAVTGVESPNGDPVVVDGGGGPAFRVVNKVGLAPMSFSGLTLRGNQGIRASVDTRVVDARFEFVSQEALEFDAGQHVVRDTTIEAPAVGARVATGAGLDLARTTVDGATDAGLVVEGTANVANVTIGNGVDGVRPGAMGIVSLSYSTLVGNTGYGIDNGQGGAVDVDRSIVAGSALGDLLAVPCTDVTWSLVSSPDCSAVGDNLTGDPLLDPDLRPTAGSPCLDHGPDPSTFSGLPATDLDGGPRLRDADGDGLAENDCGAYEFAPQAPIPGEVLNVRFETDFRMVWDAEPAAVEYHVYRDALANLSYVAFGACRDDLDAAGRTDTQLDDFEAPTPGAAFFYLVTAEDALGEEGSLGLGTRAERSAFAACP